jgi:2-polyprenyl-6-methoxyphenol hydroxylase-like FAD-dependent oxidoreductase
VMPKSGSWSVFSSAFAGRDAVTSAIAGGIDVAALDGRRLLDGTEDYVLASLIVHRRAVPEDVAGPEAQAVALEILRDQHPTLRRVFADSDPASVIGMWFKQSTLIDPWPSTTATVLGDAIHNMTPVGGLGANSALRDAAALAGRLLAVRDGSPLLPAIAAYESAMREWGYAAARESRRNAQRAITANPVARRTAHAYFRTRRVLAGLGRRTRPGQRPRPRQDAPSMREVG